MLGRWKKTWHQAPPQHQHQPGGPSPPRQKQARAASAVHKHQQGRANAAPQPKGSELLQPDLPAAEGGEVQAEGVDPTPAEGAEAAGGEVVVGAGAESDPVVSEPPQSEAVPPQGEASGEALACGLPADDLGQWGFPAAASDMVWKG